MKSILKKNNITAQGFTLLEMLFAVIIFSFALVSLMTIAGKGVIATTTAREQLTAQFLAEESLEIARNIRDSNYINGSNWTDGLTQCIGASCDVEYVLGQKPTLEPCLSGGCNRILYNISGQYRPDPSFGGTATQFTREIRITEITPDKELLMESTVYWKQKTLNRKLTVRTRIANW
jgi:prepilin-type N-terminal cleavage/methylation domain-containing protein